MPMRKEDGADLRKRYPLFIQGGMILALVILITAFRLNFDSGPTKTYRMDDQETVDIKEVQQTQQKKQPPPPPRPPVPVERPDEEVVENEELDFDATMDLNQSLSTETVEEAPPAPEPQEEEEEVVPFAVVEEQPEMIGGRAALQNAAEYPGFAQRANIEGTVFLQFTVTKDGGVRDIKVLRSPNDVLTEPAIEALRKMKFKPGKQRTKPVEVRMSQRVVFKLR